MVNIGVLLAECYKLKVHDEISESILFVSKISHEPVDGFSSLAVRQQQFKMATTD